MTKPGFFCKSIQGLGTTCRTDICIAMAGTGRVESIIDTKKLMFLGRLVRINNQTLANQLFQARAIQFLVHKCKDFNTTEPLGFIPDVVRILNKYDLQMHWERLMASGFTEFPLQSKWKKLVKIAVKDYEQRAWTERIASDSDFSEFRNIHKDISTPARIWTFSKKHPES